MGVMRPREGRRSILGDWDSGRPRGPRVAHTSRRFLSGGMRPWGAHARVVSGCLGLRISRKIEPHFAFIAVTARSAEAEFPEKADSPTVR
jgi:hypothetical protein